MDDKKFKQLISKQLSGKPLTRQEKHVLESFEKELIRQNANTVFKSVLHERAVKSRLDHSLNKKTASKVSRKWVFIAASIVFLLGISATWFYTPSTSIVVVNTTDSTKEVTLPDGSNVILNHHSKLSYPENFNKNTRDVRLTGEAYFKVSKDQKRPFTVSTGALSTRVLGTAFNIRETDSIIDVTVSEGLVRVFNSNEAYQITHDQQVSYHLQHQSLSKRNINHHLSTYWFHNKLQLHNITMKELSELIDVLYGVKTSFASPNLQNLKMSISFNKDLPLEKLISQLNYINNLTLKIEDHMIKVTP